MQCRLYQYVSKFVTVAVSVLFVWMLVGFFRNRRRKNEAKKKKLFVMVDGILEFLTKQSQARYAEVKVMTSCCVVMKGRKEEKRKRKKDRRSYRQKKTDEIKRQKRDRQKDK